MTIHAEPGRHGARGVYFLRVSLAVQDCERVQAKSFGSRNRGRRVGIEPTAEKHYCVGHKTPGVIFVHFEEKITPGVVSHAARVGAPNVFMQLKLNANGQAICDHPLGQSFRVEDAMHGR